MHLCAATPMIFSPPLTCGLGPAGHDPNQGADQRPQAGGEGAVQGRTVLSSDIRGERRVDAAFSRPVPVPGQSSEPLSGASGSFAAMAGQVSVVRASARWHASTAKSSLDSKWPIDAAMREAGGLHQVRDADAVEASLAKQPAGGVDDVVPVLGGLFPAHPHRCPHGSKKKRLTLYMTSDIYRKE
jgi:hypothetical protein